MRTCRSPLLLLPLLSLATGCQGMPSGEPIAVTAALGGPGGQGREQDDDEEEYEELVEHEGRRLFEKETFGGNGRTCLTCHPMGTGTLSPADVKAIKQKRPHDPLFLHDGSDDFAGHGTSRIEADATILVRIPLPAGVHLADDPGATSVTLRHGIPSTLNTPALDPVLMYDGRAPDLVEQARGAISDHTQHALQPSPQQLLLIADFQKTEDFFTSNALRKFADGGKAPELPAGKSASEKRGRRFFEDGPINVADGSGFCALCHSGPLLNQSNGWNPIPIPPFFVPKGERFQSVLSGELLPNGDAFRPYLATDPETGAIFSTVSSDPGRALQTGDFRGFPFGDLGKFKIPSLRGVRHTAPYFHNNGAKTLDDVIDHYRQFFIIAIPVVLPGTQPYVLTQQDQADLIAFMNLL